MIDWKSLHGDAFAGRRVLVTGGAGFIGSHLCEALIELDAQVVALDDLSGGSWDNLAAFGDQVEQITASVLDTQQLAEAVQSCTYVFHQAALGSVPASVEHPRHYYQVNVQGTLEVLDAARAAGVKRVMFAASSSAYGNPPDTGPKSEDLPPLPQSPYAATKLAGEHTLRTWFHSYGLDGVSLRYFNIFGPRQSPDSAYAAVIAAFASALHQNRRPTIFGDGTQTRDFTYVANAVHANLLAAAHPQPLQGRVLNVAAGQRVSLNQLYHEMAALFNRPDLAPEYHPARAGDIAHSQADLTRTRQALGYEPQISFSQGLEETVAWYQQHLLR
ncbi:MAG: NAD-dependent epimerase/dehydratase family protein [Phycisphaeraceae bacterium]